MMRIEFGIIVSSREFANLYCVTASNCLFKSTNAPAPFRYIAGCYVVDGW